MRTATIVAVVMVMVAGISGFGISPASAAPITFTVATTADTHLASPVGTTCVGTGGPCSLRAATEAANNLGGTVTINVPAGTYNLTLNSALLVGTKANANVTINGALASTTIVNAIQPSSCPATLASCVQVFQLDSDGTNPVAGVTVTLSGLTISGGQVSGTNASITADSGAGVSSGGPLNGAKTVTNLVGDIIANNTILGTATNAPGGGVSNLGGDLTVTNCTFSNNSSGSSNGGAIDFESFDGSADTLTVTGSTFTNNTATSAFGAGGGGAIYVAANGTASTASITTSTFSGNTANDDGNGSASTGGGAILQDGGTLVANSNTFVGNTTTGGASVGGAVNLVSSTGTPVTGTLAANRFVSNSDGLATGGTLAANTNAAIAANDNWWASNTGPTAAALTTGVTASTYLTLRITVAPNPVIGGQNTTVTGDLTHDQSNAVYSAQAVLPSVATFAGTAGTYGGGAAGTWVAGQVTDTLTAGSGGTFPAGAQVTIDGVTVSTAVTVIDPAPPTITSANNATFKVGTAGTFAVTTATTTEFPLPSLSIGGATLPSGVTFVDHANGTATLAGTPATGTGGTYSFTITAHSTTAPDATQSFTLTVNESPIITSATATTFAVGSPGTFLVTTATDFPTATALTESGALPTGVTFVDHNNGTATLAGTPAAGSGGSYPITVTASNGILPNATQSFTLTVNEVASITSAGNVTFLVGTAGTFPIATLGFPHPTLSDGSPSLPAGVSFVDNGDGTATLAGTPSTGTGGSYPFTITAHNTSGPDATQAFTLTVNEAASITSAASTTFVVGTAGSFGVTTGNSFPVGTVLSETGALPGGVTFVDNTNGSATLAGTPAAGTGKTYPLTITAHTATGPDATQSFTLTVNEAASITSADNTTFTVGTSSSFGVTTGNSFPVGTVLSETGALPGGVTFVDNTNGSATLAGTPAAGTGKTYPLTITAHSATGPDATQSFTLTVNEAPTITSAASTTFTVGVIGTFQITTGNTFPVAPTLSEGGASLPTGVHFLDNGDGTATLTGMASPSFGGTYTFTITASNGINPDASQSFTLTVNEVPTITSANSADFAVGVPGTFLITAPGFPEPSIVETGGLPAGVTLVDHLDGTATLAGTPAVGSGGSYPLTITAHNSTLPEATQAFTLTVSEAPSISSAGQATFTVGAAGTFSVTTGHDFPVATTLSDGGATLPADVTFVDNLNGTATLSGTAVAGTGGTYTFTITAANGMSPDATQLFTLTVLEAPSFTSVDNATFRVGAAGSFSVTTGHAFPTPSALTMTIAGTLPAGVSFEDKKNGTATLTGSPAAGSGGVYGFTITAANTTLPDATQSFTLTVLEAPSFTSVDNATFTVGALGSFTVTTGHDFPTPSVLSVTGGLPSGVTFVPNPNGTATLSGTPAATTGGVYPLTITAANTTVPNATQTFTLTVLEAPSITSANSATFTVGTLGSLTVTTAHDFPALTSLLESGALPAGVTFVDNLNGSATLSGTPSAITGGVYPLTITAANSTSPDATQGFTLTVLEAPSFTSANSATFTVGALGSFTVTTGHDFPTATALSVSGALPGGVTFTDNANGTATLSGTPASGSGKVYALTLTATNTTLPNATQTFTLTVLEAPSITSIDTATFTVGSFGTFTVTTGNDFPTPSTLSAVGALPSGVTFVPNPNGTATLSGTPSVATGGIYPLAITAANTTLPDAMQTLTLTILEAPSIRTGNATTFTVGASGSFLVRTNHAFPTPSTLTEGGALPAGVAFEDKKDGTASLSGMPAAGTGGVFTLTLTASNGTSPDAVQTFTLTVLEAPSITSPDNATFTVGTLGTFTVITGHDFPTPSVLSESGGLPGGVTFVANPNGTATLSGTPSATTGGIYALTITAANGTSPDATQSFTLTVHEAPFVTSAAATTFTVGGAGNFIITTGGFLTPTLSEAGALPAGVNFDDKGDGTASLSGTPAATTGGVYPLTITAANSTLPDATQSFTLTIDESPSITSAAATTMTVGAAGSFVVTTAHNFPTPTSLSEVGALPAGVNFVDNGDGTATLAGTPAAGTGAIYTATVTAHNSATLDGTQLFTLTVDQAPAITSAGTANASVGVASSFAVTTSGFPVAAGLSETGALPAGVGFVDNGDGTASMSGTPGAATQGSYAIAITANNGTAPNATQNFTLTVYSRLQVLTTSLPTGLTGVPYSGQLTAAGGKPGVGSAYTWAVTSGTLPPGMTLNTSTGAISGTPTGPGSHSITVTVTDSLAVTASASVIFVVLPSGLWMAGSDGGVFAIGAAVYHGSLPGLGVHTSSIVGMASAPSGHGYWLVGSDGGVFTFGDAGYFGSVPGLGVHTSSIVGMASSPSGHGYWLVGSDGGVFTFGDAAYFGSVPGLGIHTASIVALASSPDGHGYWLIGSDGGVFSFGDAGFKGSAPSVGIHVADIVGMVDIADGSGYWLIGADGRLFAFGAATTLAGLSSPPHFPIVGDGGS